MMSGLSYDAMLAIILSNYYRDAFSCEFLGLYGSLTHLTQDLVNLVNEEEAKVNT
mgnify:CR=1 FL=1